MKLSYPIGPKCGWLEQAEKIVSGEAVLSPSEIPMLLIWLKDMNWPGAHQIAQYLSAQDRSLAPHIATVLASGDLVWIHWVLDTLADSFDTDSWRPMADALQEIAFQWDGEGAHIDCLYILARHRLAPLNRIRTAVEAKRQMKDADPDDYLKIETLLNDT